MAGAWSGGVSRGLLHIGQMAKQRLTLNPPNEICPRIMLTVGASVACDARSIWRMANDKRKCFRAPYKQMWIQKQLLASRDAWVAIPECK
jgi:hypothetical protein